MILLRRLFIMASFLLMLASCKKDNSPAETDLPQCRIWTIGLSQEPQYNVHYTSDKITSMSNSVDDSIVYNYNTAGQLIARNEYFPGGHQTIKEYTFQYDNAGRVTREVLIYRSNGTSTPDVYQSFLYDYNNEGNISMYSRYGQIDTPDSLLSEQHVYTWSNGNLIAVKVQDPGATYDCDYIFSYDDTHLNKFTADYPQYYFIDPYHWPGTFNFIFTKNPMISFTHPCTGRIEPCPVTYNEQGYIASYKYGYVATEVTYECE